MTAIEPEQHCSGHQQKLKAAIFDVDGVLLESPHERAWREALAGFADPSHFTPELYETRVAGKPRLAGARAVLEELGVPDANNQAFLYAELKQKRLEELIGASKVAAFPDALRFVQAVAALGWPMAVAPSSKNANRMMKAIRLPSGQSLFDLFRVNVCGRDLAGGQAASGNLPACRRGTEDGTGLVLRRRGRACRHHGRACGRHDSLGRRPLRGDAPLLDAAWL